MNAKTFPTVEAFKEAVKEWWTEVFERQGRPADFNIELGRMEITDDWWLESETHAGGETFIARVPALSIMDPRGEA